MPKQTVFTNDAPPPGGPYSPAVIAGDFVYLAGAKIVDNLLSNVRAHTPPATPVRVSVGPRERSAVIDVHDSGPGLETRRYRARLRALLPRRKSRARASGGVGLGLSIVAAVAAAHAAASPRTRGTAAARRSASRSPSSQWMTTHIQLQVISQPWALPLVRQRQREAYDQVGGAPA